MALRDDTRDLHHACEAHRIGAAMSAGTVSEQAWADWLGCLLIVHSDMDPRLPEPLRRTDRLRRDLDEMNRRGFWARQNHAAVWFVASSVPLEALAYVFTGAHLMGGAVMEKRLGERLPCEHLRWDDRRASLDLWRPYREAEGISDHARDAFAAILAMMDEIDD